MKRALLAIALLLAPVATPRSAQNAQLTDGRVAPALSSARTGAPQPYPAAGLSSENSDSRAATPSERTTNDGGAPLLVSGTATWYSWRPGEAAAGPALRAALGSGWRGSTVTVTSAGHSVTVRLTDWCACGSGRIIDLDSRSFARLAPLSTGVIRVTVSSGGPAPEPTAPGTDYVP